MVVVVEALDDNATLAAKLKYALGAGMTVVFCIGEPKPIREAGLEAVLAEMDVQLTQVRRQAGVERRRGRATDGFAMNS